MCNPASFIVTQNGAFWHPTEDLHSAIAERHRLDMGDRAMSKHVSVEISPPDRDYMLPFDQWVFKTDQTDLPDWYSAQWAEQMCREELPRWAEKHLGEIITLGCGDAPRQFRFCNGNLDLCRTGVTDLGQLQSVGGDLDLWRTGVKNLGQLQSVGGDLTLSYTGVKDLGQLQSVGEDLNLWRTGVTDLGQLRSVGGSLNLSYTGVLDLGQLQSVGGNLNLRGTGVKDLGQLQSVGGDLDLRGTGVTDIPEWASGKIISLV